VDHSTHTHEHIACIIGIGRKTDAIII